ncbi:MAG: ATP-binding protein [Candidatus Latescibacteria bacterium]|nr:ATP-binding protein [Candidatus Latescibacterota bacterium]
MKTSDILYTLGVTRSIKNRLVVPVGLLIAGISLFISLHFPARLEEQAVAGVVDKAQSIAEMTAFSASAPVAFLDREELAESVGGAWQNEGVVYIVVRDLSGNDLLALDREGAGEAGIRGIDTAAAGVDGGRICRASAPVVMNGQQIGTLHLGFSLAAVQEAVSQSRAAAILIGLIVFVTGVGVAIGIGAVVVRPLHQVVDAARRIEEGDLTQRAAVASSDEVGRLAGAFNHMVERIEERTAELENEIRERKAAAMALRESEATNLALLNAIPDLMFRIARDGTFLDYKAKPNDLYVPPGSIVGTRISESFPSEVSEIAMRHIEEALESGRIQRFEYHLPIQGVTRHYETRVVVSGEDEVLAIARDVTDQKLAEEARTWAEQELEEQKALSMRGDRLRSLGEMAAGIAHELNQPLVGVRGLAEHVLIAMERGWDLSRGKLEDRLRRIVDQADRMVHIIQHVRMFAREAGKKEVSPVEINDVVRSGMDMLDAQFKSHGVHLRAELADGLPCVLANPFSLEEVLINLLNNSRDAVEERLGEKGESQDGRVVVRTRASSGDRIEIEVEDNGTGIPEEAVARVFDPFFTTKDPDRGTGLGLSVSRSIVEEFGGTIGIGPAAGRGTSATIILPARPPLQSQEA